MYCLLCLQAARRELERQRQLEWERQRRDQLMAEKQREQALVDAAQADVAKMKLELEALVRDREGRGTACSSISLACNTATLHVLISL